MTVHDEQELLLQSGNHKTSNNGSFDGGNNINHSAVHNVINSSTIIIPDKKPRGYGAVDDRGGGDRDGGHGPGNGFAIQELNRITYTWFDINVFTAALQPQTYRSRLISGLSSGTITPVIPANTSPLPQQRKHILKNVNGVARPGELLAIMGSSGAGKTTLLNTLTFRSPSSVVVSGVRCVNGVPVDSTALTSLSAYVQQDDLFIGTLTVKEHLIFQALVRMDRQIPYSRRLERVEEVLTELALKKCENTTIGIPGRVKGISGGEMKRLSFASEVLTDPPLMFCDEPTSGLDSFMAQNVVQVLKNLAQTGKTVICTIHQPSSELYAMFDKLLLMAEGRVAFLGLSEEAFVFFNQLGAPCPSNYNPADYYVQLLAIVPTREETCRQTIEMVCDNFEKCEYGQSIAAEAAANANNQWEFSDVFADSCDVKRGPYKASWIKQFRAVFWRSWISVTKDPMLIKVRILQTILVSVLMGIIYCGQKLDQDGVMNINGALYIFLTNMTFQNVFAVITVFCTELPIFLREHRSGMYRTDVYFLCKTLAEIPLFIIIPFIFVSIAYYIIGLNPIQPRFFIAGGVVALVANVATSFGYLISCASSSVSMALSLGPPVVIPFMLFGGFFLNDGSVPVYFKWLSYLSWFRYGNEALLINQWAGVDSIDCTNSNSTCPKDGHVVLATLHFSEDDFAFDIICLLLLILGFRLVAFLLLLSRTCRKE